MKKCRVKIKRSIILLLCICITGTSIPVFAKEQGDSYEKGVIERYWESFEIDDGSYYENLVNTKEYSYVRWADALDGKNKVEKAFLWATNFLLDKKMNTEANVNYLTTILSMMDAGLEDSIWEQASYTAEKNIDDFVGETFELGLETFLGTTTYSRLNETLKIFFDVKDIADLGSVTITDTVQLYVYSVASASYEKKRIFLEELEAYAKDKKLKKAAEQVLKVIDLEFSYVMLNYADDFLFDTVGLGMDVSVVSWAENVNPAICKMVSENLAPWLAEHGKTKLAEGALFVSDAVKNYGAKVGLFVKTMLLTGKAAALVVGDDVEMYRELKVMDSMSDALTEALHDYSNNVVKGSTEKQYEDVYKYVVVGEALSYVHTRGEYCVSEIRKRQGNYPEEAGKEYIEWTKKLQEGYEILEKILPEPEQYVVTEGFTLSNGFIEKVIQRKTVPENYIGIYDFSDLMAARDNPNENYILMNDIVCGEYEFKETTFTGILDGNGYKISNIKNPLFSKWEGGTAKNLGLHMDAAVNFKNSKVLEWCDWYDHSDGAWGGLACYAYGDFVINNCYVEGSIYIMEGGNVEVGGLFGICGSSGYSGAASYINCYNKADITVEYRFAEVRVGGLVGDYHGDRPEEEGVTYRFENCFNEGDIILYAEGRTANGYAGGICGAVYSSDIIGCYNTGNIKINVGEESPNVLCRDNAWLKAGGIVGKMTGNIDGNKIEGCWNSGDITSQSKNAVLEKDEWDVYHYERLADRICAGGVVGICITVGIYKCFNSGQINGRIYAGGIAGVYLGQAESVIISNEWDAQINDCYNTGNIKGNYLAGGILGLLEDFAYFHNCYTIGEVSKEAILGGQFAGYLSLRAEYENCFYQSKGRNNATGTINISNEIEGLGKVEIQLKDTYKGYDFINVWKFEKEDSVTPAKLRY